MRAPDSLEALACDLRALPAGDRRAILSSLSAFERAKMSILLQQVDARVDAGPARDPDFRQFSPWLAAHLRQARSETGDGAATHNVTPATRRLLVRIGDEKASSLPVHVPAESEPRRTLMGALAALLLPASLVS